LRTRTQRLLNAVERPEVYEEVLLEASGASVVLSVWSGESGTATVVFLPGTMTHPLFFEELLDGLARTGFNVVGVHFQGHGKSPRVKRLFSLDDLIQNAFDAVSYASERFGSEVLVLGSSQGGVIATALAARDPRIKAVFAHNVLDPSVPESIGITRFPSWLEPYHKTILAGVKAAASVLPRQEIPLGFYLDDRRVFREEWSREQFNYDPLALRSYPLYFLSSLFCADMGFLTSGEISCPVVIVASTGDKLFPFDYVQRIYERIVAPDKEMLVFELDRHLIFNECVEEVLPTLCAKLGEYSTSQAG
jgi:alpha-beta hydrolase superfamily lysophospholipase